MEPCAGFGFGGAKFAQAVEGGFREFVEFWSRVVWGGGFSEFVGGNVEVVSEVGGDDVSTDGFAEPPCIACWKGCTDGC